MQESPIPESILYKNIRDEKVENFQLFDLVENPGFNCKVIAK